MSNPADVEFSKTEDHRQIAAHIVTLLQAIRYGSIEIVIHDGRVVQIDRHEKFRVKTQPNQY